LLAPRAARPIQQPRNPLGDMAGGKHSAPLVTCG